MDGRRGGRGWSRDKPVSSYASLASGPPPTYVQGRGGRRSGWEKDDRAQTPPPQSNAPRGGGISPYNSGRGGRGSTGGRYDGDRGRGGRGSFRGGGDHGRGRNEGFERRRPDQYTPTSPDRSGYESGEIMPINRPLSHPRRGSRGSEDPNMPPNNTSFEGGRGGGGGRLSSDIDGGGRFIPRGGGRGRGGRFFDRGGGRGGRSDFRGRGRGADGHESFSSNREWTPSSDPQNRQMGDTRGGDTRGSDSMNGPPYASRGDDRGSIQRDKPFPPRDSVRRNSYSSLGGDPATGPNRGIEARPDDDRFGKRRRDDDGFQAMDYEEKRARGTDLGPKYRPNDNARPFGQDDGPRPGFDSRSQELNRRDVDPRSFDGPARRDDVRPSSPVNEERRGGFYSNQRGRGPRIEDSSVRTHVDETRAMHREMGRGPRQQSHGDLASAGRVHPYRDEADRDSVGFRAGDSGSAPLHSQLHARQPFGNDSNRDSHVPPVSRPLEEHGQRGRQSTRGLDPREPDPRGLDSRVPDNRGLDNRGPDPRGLDARGLDSRAPDNRGLDPRVVVDNRGTELRGPDNRGPDPRGPDNRGPDPRGLDNRGTELRGPDNRGLDNRGTELRGPDNRGPDPRGPDNRGLDPRGLDNRGLDNRGTELRGPDNRGPDNRGPDPRGLDNRGTDLRGPDNRGADPHGPDHRSADPRGLDNRGTDPRGLGTRGPDPRGPDNRGPDPRGLDNRGPDPRGLDNRGPDPRGLDNRGLDSRGPDPRGPNVRGPDQRGPDIRGSDSRGPDMRGPDLRGVDPRASDPRGLESSDGFRPRTGDDLQTHTPTRYPSEMYPRQLPIDGERGRDVRGNDESRGGYKPSTTMHASGRDEWSSPQQNRSIMQPSSLPPRRTSLPHSADLSGSHLPNTHADMGFSDSRGQPPFEKRGGFQDRGFGRGRGRGAGRGGRGRGRGEFGRFGPAGRTQADSYRSLGGRDGQRPNVSTYRGLEDTRLPKPEDTPVPDDTGKTSNESTSGKTGEDLKQPMVAAGSLRSTMAQVQAEEQVDAREKPHDTAGDENKAQSSGVQEKPEERSISPPPPGKASGVVLALARLADLEAQMEYAYAKHFQLVKKQQALKHQTKILETLPVGVEAFKEELEAFKAEAAANAELYQ